MNSMRLQHGKFRLTPERSANEDKTSAIICHSL